MSTPAFPGSPRPLLAASKRRAKHSQGRIGADGGLDSLTVNGSLPIHSARPSLFILRALDIRLIFLFHILGAGPLLRLGSWGADHR
jgi:hypothetical protein